MTFIRLRTLVICVFVASATILAAIPGLAQDNEKAPNPLEPFSKLVGGEWHSADNYHAFEWGLAKLSLTSKSYFMIEGKPKLVSDGFWYYHPGTKSIRAIATTIGMGVDVWDYTSTFVDNVLRNEIITYTTDGTAAEYVETWEFTDDNTYVWKLFTKTDEGLSEMMGSTYRRKK